MRLTNFLWLAVFVIISKAGASGFVIKNNQGKAVSETVVYLEPQFTGDFSAYYSSREKYDVLQKSKKFSPYITVVAKGDRPVFSNKDDITHHVYSAVGPKRFSFKLKADKSKSDITFDKAGHVPMGCNIHDWMSGHILVVDTPFYGITDTAGQISFENLPAGKYKLNVWHPQLKAKANLESAFVELPLSSPMKIKLSAGFSPVPEQSTLDEFEFLEDY